MINNCIITSAAIVFLITGCAKTIDVEKGTKLKSDTEYTCENGKKLNVAYFTTRENVRRARIKFEGVIYDLKSVVSASGAKYSDGKYTWWTKGSSGFFEIEDIITLKSCVSQGEN